MPPARARASNGRSAPSTRSSASASTTCARPPTTARRASRRCCAGLTRFGWEPVEEHGKLIALLRATAPRSRSSRPASSSSPAPCCDNIHETCREINAAPARSQDGRRAELGLGFLGMGFQPKWRREDMPWMPKGRYEIMRDYMPKVGKLGLDMMIRTCTVQVNLDFSSEADMVKKFRVSLALQPIATALFADSPFTEGKPNGFLQLPLAHLDRHRSRPHRHARLRVRGRLRLRALCRLRARRADVLRLPRRRIHRPRRPAASATSWAASCRRCPASCRP